MADPLYVSDAQAAWQIGELLEGMPADKLEALHDRIRIASAIVAGYVTDPDPAWADPATAPGDVQQATLLLVAYFWRNRGDLVQDAGASDPDRDDTHPWPAFRSVLRRRKDPILK